MTLSQTDAAPSQSAENPASGNAPELAALLDAAPVMVWASGPDKGCTYFNRGWLEFTGLTLVQSLGDGWAEVVHPDDLAHCLTTYTEAFDRREPFRMEYRLRRADGEYRWVTDRGAPRHASDGGFIGYVGSCMDITEQKQVEAALRESEELKDRVIESSRDCIKVLDIQGRLLSMSAGGRELLEIRNIQPLLGASWPDLWPQAAREKARAAVAAARAGGIGQFTEYYPTVTGKPKWWDVIINPVRDARGSVERLLAVSRDITDRRLAEEALRRSEAEFRAMFELSAVGKGQADCETGRILRANRKFCEMLGYSAEELLGMSIRDITHPDDLALNLDLLEKARRGEIDEYAFEKRYIRKDGRIIWVYLTSTVLRDPEGRPLHTIAELQDISARKQSEQALQEAKARLEEAEHIARLGSWDWDVATGVVRWSQGLYSLLGFDPDSFAPTYETALDLVPEYDRNRVHETVQRALEERSDYRLEHDMRRPDGITLTTLAVAKCFYDADGQPWRMVGTLLDITERKQAEAERDKLLGQLTLERASLKGILRQMPAGVFIAEAPSGRLVLGNRQAAEIWRQPLIASSNISEYSAYPGFHPDDGRPYLPEEWPLARALQSGETVTDEEIDILRGDDTHATISVSATPIRAADGQIVAGVVTLHDITERRHMEKALRESEARFRALVETVPDILYRATLPGYITTFISLENKNLMGFTREEWLTQPDLWSAQVHEDDRERVHRELEEQVAGQEFYAVEYRLRHKDAKTFRWFRDHGRVERDDQGRAVALFGVMSDITEHRNAEAALREADRRKDEFLATLAHELRNPLAPISNALHLIRRGAGNPAMTNTALDIAERQLRQLVRLVDDLLDISRITRGKVMLHKAPVVLSTVLRNALETSRPQIDARSHRLTVDTPAEPVQLEADALRLAQAVANLLINAAKFTEPGGHIRLTACSEEDEVVIAVQDTGIGIPAGELSKVFDLFTQIEQPKGNTARGLGVGLALVKSLVEMHGGSVRATSGGVGQGSLFTIRLPRRPSETTAETTRARHAARATSSPQARRILVVDDDADVARSMAMLLQTCGHEVQTAGDGPSAIAAAHEHRPDVVLLDIGMPGMNGYEAARRLRRQPELQGTLLIALTGWGQETDRQRSREAGFDHHLVKPVDLAVLETLLRNDADESCAP